MIPMLIGNADRALHAVFSPSASKRRRRAVVFCPPFGAEYAHTHRAARLLAQRLAAVGYDVLRFDYYGTGDSSGDDHEFTPEGAVEDALAAVDEAKDLSGARRVMLVGMRHGAAVALRVAARVGGVDRLVLWEPVVDPAAIAAESPTADTLILVSANSEEHHRLRDQLAQVGPRVILEEHPGPPPWIAHGEEGVGVAPVAAIDRIVGWEA